MRDEISIGRFDGWVKGSVPVQRDRMELLQMQASIPAPAKFATGPVLSSEAAAERDAAAAEQAVRHALGLGLQVLRGGAVPHADAPALDVLLELLRTAGPAEWSREGAVITGVSRDRKTTVLCNGAVVLRCRLGGVAGASPASLNATAHFALALNARLRAARVSLVDRELILESVVPFEALTPEAIGRALGALNVGFALARKPCAALLVQQTAERYLEFFKEE